MPFIAVAILLFALQPLSFPICFVALAHAWAIPELYAKRGANVLRPAKRVGADSERVALGLLGDLVGHEARELHARTGLILECGSLGVWLVGEAGAVLVAERGRRVHCMCIRITQPATPAGTREDPSLPSADRIAHLLLALREDEQGFATVANSAFSGAPWRLRRRLAPDVRPALAAAVAVARA